MQHRRRQRCPQHEAEASGEGRGRGGGMALAQGQAEERGIAGHRRRQRPAEGEEAQGIHAAGADGQQRQTDVRPVETLPADRSFPRRSSSGLQPSALAEIFSDRAFERRGAALQRRCFRRRHLGPDHLAHPLASHHAGQRERDVVALGCGSRRGRPRARRAGSPRRPARPPCRRHIGWRRCPR